MPLVELLAILVIPWNTMAVLPSKISYFIVDTLYPGRSVFLLQDRPPEPTYALSIPRLAGCGPYSAVVQGSLGVSVAKRGYEL